MIKDFCTKDNFLPLNRQLKIFKWATIYKTRPKTLKNAIVSGWINKIWENTKFHRNVKKICLRSALSNLTLIISRRKWLTTKEIKVVAIEEFNSMIKRERKDKKLYSNIKETTKKKWKRNVHSNLSYAKKTIQFKVGICS